MAGTHDKPQGGLCDLNRRGAKLWLFALLAAVMLVLAVGERLLDADFRQWLSGGMASRANEEIDTRLPPPTVAGELDTFVADKSQPPPTGWEEALSRVQDDTLFLRPAERTAWQLIEERVRATDQGELRRKSLGEIGFTQLFRQPEVYRGQVVTVRGRVMYCTRARVGDDAQFGDDEPSSERFVLWIMPAGRPTLPIVVYAQAMPAGFPTIERLPGGRLTRMREDVTVIGILLKRGSYHATDGPRTAPVIIANVPEWSRERIAAADSSRFGPSWFWPTAGAALGLAALLVAVAVWLTRQARGQGRGATEGRLVAADFRNVSLGPTTAEVLRQMERERSDPT